MQQLDWNATIDAIRETTPQAQFQNWIKPLQLIRFDERSVVLGVPSRFHEEWLRSHYHLKLSQAIRKQCGSDLQLEFEVLAREEKHEAPRLSPVSNASSRPILRIVDSAPNFAPIPEAPPKTEQPNLPPCNHPFLQLAYNNVAFQCAALFAEGKDPQLNPLVLVAGVGMGKTHLLTEIGLRIQSEQPDLQIRYTNAESFTIEMVQSLKNNTNPVFKRKYREQTDILLFDDIQGIARRMRTQEELLHIFNEILNRGGRVAFSSSVSPHRLTDFIEPLRSRLLSGVMAEVKYPTYEERVEVLNRMSAIHQINVEGHVLRSLADKGQKDVRELIGTLLQIHLQSKIENRPISTEFLAEEGWIRESQREAITMEEITSLVEHNFGVPRTELVSKSRKSLISWARQVAMYLARTYTQISLEEIGRNFGRDHATVIHAFQKVTETMEQQPQRRYEVEFLKQRLQNRSPRGTDVPLL